MESPVNKGKQKSDYLLLLVIIVAYTSLVYYLSLMRYENFYTSNWDFGIARQLLWTGSHGYLLFETGDYSASGIMSFLQVHSTYIAIPLAYLYSVFPTASFLFVLQSSIIAISIIPFYFIARDVLSDRRFVFLSLFAYLFSFTLLSAVFYDFHWELFLPVEYLTMFYLIRKQRYALSLIPLFFGVVTLEVFPFMAAGLIIYFAYQRFGWKFLKPLTLESKEEWLKLTSIFFIIVLSYVAIRLLQFYVVPAAAGVQHASTVTIGATGFIPRGLNPTTLATSSVYWLVIYLSFGFLPFLYKRHFLLLLPWMFGSVFIVPNLSSTFGNQYTAITLPMISVGFLLGIATVKNNEKWTKLGVLIIAEILFLSAIAILLDFSRILMNPGPPRGVLAIIVVGLSFLSIFTLSKAILNIAKLRKINITKGLNTSARKITFLLVAALIVFNIAIGPLNPQNFAATAGPGYQISYTANPEFQYALSISKEIPYNATVVASDNLFPMVANNPNAYSLLWFEFNSSILPFFPFNSTHLPTFLFIDSYQGLLVPNFIQEKINDSSYGVVAYTTFNSYPGDIYLLELNYYGTTTHYDVK